MYASLINVTHLNLLLLFGMITLIVRILVNKVTHHFFNWAKNMIRSSWNSAFIPESCLPIMDDVSHDYAFVYTHTCTHTHMHIHTMRAF